MRPRLVVPLLTAVLLAAGCTSDGPDDGTSRPGSATPTKAAATSPKPSTTSPSYAHAVPVADAIGVTVSALTRAQLKRRSNTIRLEQIPKPLRAGREYRITATYLAAQRPDRPLAVRLDISGAEQELTCPQPFVVEYPHAYRATCTVTFMRGTSTFEVAVIDPVTGRSAGSRSRVRLAVRS